MKNRPIEACVLAVVFAIAHTQSPLFFSNQNQYLLHGAALAGDGQLAHDWLANTHDPTPVFSRLVQACYLTHTSLLHVSFFLLLMSYFLIARRIALALGADRPLARLLFAVLFTTIHAGFVRWLSVRMFGFDYPWFAQAGLAAQYLIGPGLQPSAFGVLLLAACAAILERRSPVVIATLVGLPCLMHSAYLLPAGLMFGSYLIAGWFGRETKRGLAVGAVVALVWVAFPVALAVRDFLSEPTGRAEAMRLFADVRIPHHCRPARWFDAVAAIQIVWMLAGLVMLRDKLLGRAMAYAFVAATLLSILQIATDSHALALLFPWRLSVVLVPLATVVGLAKFGRWATEHPLSTKSQALLALIHLLFMIFLVGSGLFVMTAGLGYRTAVEEEPLYRYLRSHAQLTDVFFVPARIPGVSTGRGAVSNTFAPPPRAGVGTNQIPVDLQRARLMGGISIFVDFKSVPYAVPEVLEWHRRMALADEWTKSKDAALRLAGFRANGITHAILPADQSIPGTVERYRDEFYVVLEIP